MWKWNLYAFAVKSFFTENTIAPLKVAKKHKMKYVNFFLAALFALFAAVQFNDPDPLAWALLYGFVAVVSLLAGLGKYNRYVLLGGLAVCLVWLLTLIPEFVNWVQMGMPTITSSMKTEEPHIEYTREFLGLFLCGLVLLIHLRRSRKVPG